MPNATLLPARTAVLSATVALALAACSSAGAATPPPSAAGAGSQAASSIASSAAPSATAAPAGDTLDHPTGPGDIVLRAGTRGGFIRLETVMSRLPEFTLYGDGRVLILPTEEAATGGGGGGGLNPAAGGAGPIVPQTLREGRLTEPEIEALLKYALTDGRLGTARDAYLGGIMDAPSTVFEVDGGGVHKSVLVTGLTPDPQPGPDAATIKAFASLMDKLRSIPTTGTYVSDRIEAVLAESDAAPGVPLGVWPWTDLKPADFPPPPDGAAIQFPSRLLTAAQAAAVADETASGPVLQSVKGPDGKTYSLLLRPALPEEIAAG
jgi:hypothetical protein